MVPVPSEAPDRSVVPMVVAPTRAALIPVVQRVVAAMGAAPSAAARPKGGHRSVPAVPWAVPSWAKAVGPPVARSAPIAMVVAATGVVTDPAPMAVRAARAAMDAIVAVSCPASSRAPSLWRCPRARLSASRPAPPTT